MQYEDTEFEGGANTLSLKQAQRNFATFGCTEERFLGHVRPLSPEDIRDPEWQPLEDD